VVQFRHSDAQPEQAGIHSVVISAGDELVDLGVSCTDVVSF